MGLSAADITLLYVFPICGNLIGYVMFGAPIQDLLERRRIGSLGPLNPTPWAFMTGNCIGWVSYSFLIVDPFVFVPNAVGLILSVWLNLNASKLIFQEFANTKFRASIPGILEESRLYKRLDTTETEKTTDASAEIAPEEEGVVVGGGAGDHESSVKVEVETKASTGVTMTVKSKNDQDDNFWKRTLNLITLEEAPVSHENLVVLMVVFWCTALGCVALSGISKDSQASVVGILSICNLMFFYGGPLSTMVDVIKSRDSSSIHVPTMVMNTLNGTFWGGYGFGITDWIIAIPNALGALLGVVQMILCLLFPRKGEQEHQAEEKLENSGECSAVADP